MASSTIRKAIGAVKDQTSIGLAKVSSKIAPDLDVAIVKATSHDDEPADEKYVLEILNLASCSRGYASACVSTISRRLCKTRDWIVALKTLMLVHRLLNEGVPAFHHELVCATRRGTRLLNMSDFRDEAHCSSWDHSAFVRTYALYLDQLLECMVCNHKQAAAGAASGSFDSHHQQQGSQPSYSYSDNSERDPHSGGNTSSQGEEIRPSTPLRGMKPEKVLGRMNQLQLLFDRFLACRPIGLAKNNRLIFVALHPIVRESFQLYADICEILSLLLDRYFDIEYADCVKSFEAYASAAKQIDELSAFYGWCKDAGVARFSEYPEVQLITDKLLETLEEFMRDRATRPNSPLSRVEQAIAVQEEEPVQDMNSTKALPAPSDYEENQPPEEPNPEPRPQIKPQPQDDLIDLREDAGTADSQKNSLALALSSIGAAGTRNWTWETFSSSKGSGEGEGNTDWELALAESTSELGKQKTSLGGGFDPLLLNGMHRHGAVRQHMSAQASIGSSSGVALPGSGKMATSHVAWPTPDDTVQTIGGDPFAASLNIPPPSYVQMSDIEKKQVLLMQEQQLWLQYTKSGMQGPASLAMLNNARYYPNPVTQYGVPTTYY